jgi:hypothetical protein
MTGFLLDCAHEGIARALALTDRDASASHYNRAMEILHSIEDPEDADIQRSDLASIGNEMISFEFPIAE